MKYSAVALVCLMLSACGGEDNNTTTNNTTANNTTANNTTANNTTANNTTANNTTANNTTTNNTTANNTTANNTTTMGAVNVDLSVTVNGRETQLTNCEELGSSGWTELGTDPNSGAPYARMNCAIAEEGSFTAFFIVELWFFGSAAGTTVQAADFETTCGADGCTGNVSVGLTYQDGQAGIFDSAGVIPSTTKSGSFTLDTFDLATRNVGGSMDLTFQEDGLDYAISGTFSGTLAPCRNAAGCQ